ncbi:MAG: tRNA lysidine(34) synthetase TilS [Sodalis sp. (in: enterobacteria)]
MKPDAAGQVQALRHLIAIHVAPYHSLVLAYSGGLDSTVLLDALTALRDSNEALDGVNSPVLRAVHVHHGLSRNADRWADHCANECRLRDIAFTTSHVVLDATPEGIEAAARSMRYRALAATLVDNEVLLTAQHLDDQAETLLLALKRGSGPAGLAGMAADTSFCGRRLVRPLLGCARIALEAYARACGLIWIEDESNSALQFDRNFLRQQILPPLRQRWPQFSAAAARSAQLCSEQERLLDELLAETLEELIQADGSLCLTALTTMSDLRRAAVLRRWLASRGMRMPSRTQLARLWEEIALSRRDAVAHMQLDNRQVRRFRNRLYVLPRLPELSNNVPTLPWPTENQELRLPKGLGTLFRRPVDSDSGEKDKPLITPPECDSALSRLLHGGIAIAGADASIAESNNVAMNARVANSAGTAATQTIVRAPLLDERVSVRFGSVRGLLYIIGRHRGRTLKKIWQELNIPPWRRGSTPLLFYNDQLIAALGVFVTWKGAAQQYQAKWHLFWQSDNTDTKAIALESDIQHSVLSNKDSRSY